jgi:hypothetical protein
MTPKPKPKPKSPNYCQNCGTELTNQEIIYGEGWCFYCLFKEVQENE